MRAFSLRYQAKLQIFAFTDFKAMRSYQREFLDLALARNALQFGAFTLKSGRVSPYFFNAGLFNSGRALSTLGQVYAHAAIDANVPFDMLFGPAYKGIPLATTTAVALANHHDRDAPVAFKRKEAKAHGEGGQIIGAPLNGRVLIVDDVITAGTAIREALETILIHGATPVGVLIALDREERGQNALSAAQEIHIEFGIPVIAIARLTELLAFTSEHPDLKPYQAELEAYRTRYGIA